MNHKKIVSLFCAAVLSVSAFAGVVLADEEGTTSTAAAIESTVTFDFETEDTTITATDVRSVTTSVIEDPTVVSTDDAAQAFADETTNHVLSVAATSTESSKFALSTIDISEYTKGKSHIIVEYDAYIANTGRMSYVINDASPSGYSEGGVFKQGIIGKNASDIINVTLDAWVHTTVDVDLQAGTGTYTVTNGEETVSTGTIETEKTALNYIAFISWYTNTSYIDNIKIQTGGTLVIQTKDPETASTVEGSGISLIPDDATITISDDWSSVLGEKKAVLNHSTAMTAQSTENTAINAYSSENVRGKSIYAAYDVYLTPSSEVSITPYGNGGSSQASTMKLTADERGVVTVSAITSSSGGSTAEETLVHGTWYRVVVEVPQSGDADATKTGNITFTVYRIDPENPANTLGAAARLTNLAPRGVDTRAVTTFGFAVTGEAYIDNGVTYIAPNGELTYGYGEVAASYDSGKITITDNTIGNLMTEAVIVVAQSTDGMLKSAKIYPVTFSSGKATVSQTLTSGDKVFIWESVESVAPLADAYVQQ